jgi:hypothetical protein
MFYTDDGYPETGRKKENGFSSGSLRNSYYETMPAYAGGNVVLIAGGTKWDLFRQ